MDLDRYGEWNPFTTRVRSTLVVGDPIALTTTLGAISLTEVETVREVVEHERLVWGDVLYRGLVRAERVQTLTAENGGVRYRTVDTIEGPGAPIVRVLFGKALERGFSRMASALASRCRKS